MKNPVYTIGHSTHSADEFVKLLVRHQITAVADVRSGPFSRFNPQFNRDAIKATLNEAGIRYVFLGNELGARPRDRSCYLNGTVSYDLLARTKSFQHGLERIMQGARQHRIALMCAEKDPLACHRAILVSRYLAQRGVTVKHILDEGRIEGHEDAVTRLLVELGLPERDLFRGRDDIIDEAYRRRGEHIAYTEDVNLDVQTISGVNR